jgi:hypothetical protein
VALTAAGTLDPGRAQVVSKEDAVALVEALVGAQSGKSVVTGTIGTATSRAYDIEGPTFRAAVDAATGEIGFLTRFDKVPDAKDVSISKTAAIDAATALVRRGGISAPDVTPVVELIDHGTAWEYRVTWNKRVGEVEVPDQLVIRINPVTGDWYSLVRVHRAYTQPPVAKVARQEAIDSGLATIDPAARVESADLVIVFGDDGTQLLAWRLLFVLGDEGGYQAGRALLIDAISGKSIPLPTLDGAAPPPESDASPKS